MTGAMSVAAAGLMDASNRLSTAATRIVRRSTSDFPSMARSGDAGEPVPPVSGAATNPASLSQATDFAPQAGTLYVPSYAEDIVAMKMAAAAYKANARMLKASGDLSKELIDALR